MSQSFPTDEALALFSLGVPVAAIAKARGVKPSSIYSLASLHKVSRPAPEDRMLLRRIARAERIRRNIEDYPSRPMFGESEAAA